MMRKAGLSPRATGPDGSQGRSTVRRHSARHHLARGNASAGQAGQTAHRAAKGVARRGALPGGAIWAN
ncbi:MAG: hypothetical protein JJU08_12260 [Rhodobacteraceae bacterium]|nr:hypothetical protein [Paracoccaceae bacterium]